MNSLVPKPNEGRSGHRVPTVNLIKDGYTARRMVRVGIHELSQSISDLLLQSDILLRAQCRLVHVLAS